MVNPSPPEPPPSEERKNLDLDELIAVIVAFLTIGAILLWSFGTKKISFFTDNLGGLLLPTETTETRQATQEDTVGETIEEIIETEEPRTTARTLPGTQTETTRAERAQTRAEILAARRRAREAETDVTVEEDITVVPVVPVPVPKAEQAPPKPAPTTPETETTRPAPTPAPTPEKIAFNDVGQNYWAYPFIVPLAERKIFGEVSENNFDPDRPVTREELAAQIDRAFPQEPSQSAIDFEDVPKQTETATRVDEAVRTGFLKGYPGQVFRPGQEVPRVQVLVALVSGLNLKASKDPAEVLSSYQDADSIPEWARTQIAAATEAGLVVNHPNVNVLDPNRPATRAEVAAMIYQALVRAEKAEPVSSEYIVGSPSQNR